MFSSYNLKDYGDRLRNIRKSLQLSQNEVGSISQINIDTLRKIENGQCIPRFDTLERLSRVYKTDLIEILNRYKNSKLLYEFYDKLEYYLATNNIQQLTFLKDELRDIFDNNSMELIEMNDQKQLSLFIDALIKSYSNNIKDVKQSVESMIQSLIVSIPQYDLEKFSTYRYNHFEMRILFSIASILGQLRNCEMSNDILEYLLNSFDFSIHSKPSERILIIKSFSMLSYNYFRIENYDKSLYYAEKGIDYCLSNSLMHYLPLLLCRKGVALYYFNDANYPTFINQLIFC